MLGYIDYQHCSFVNNRNCNLYIENNVHFLILELDSKFTAQIPTCFANTIIVETVEFQLIIYLVIRHKHGESNKVYQSGPEMQSNKKSKFEVLNDVRSFFLEIRTTV